VTYTSRSALHENQYSGETLRPEQVGAPLAYAIGGHQRHAVLIVDAQGIIRFATTRQIFGWTDEALTDSPLQSLIPSLPVRKATPGYNIAYARLSFAEQGWQCHRALSVDGLEFPVELSVQTIPVDRSFAMLIAVREVCRGLADTAAVARTSRHRAEAMAA
jgi:hypothetical protein